MLALIAGTGALPPALVGRLSQPPLVCALAGFEPDLPVDLRFRIEHLGSFLRALRARGVSQLCMAGAIRRPAIDPTQIDAATLPLVPRIQAAMAPGDDGALRVVIQLIEEAGITVVAAHEIAPDLVVSAGILGALSPPKDATALVRIGAACLASMGEADSGQACIVGPAGVLATEGPDGTDAMITAFAASATESDGAVLFKGPKPDQDRRADMLWRKRAGVRPAPLAKEFHEVGWLGKA